MSPVVDIKYQGSAETGKVYQNIPSRPDIPYHRGKSDWRAERICEIVDVKGKTVLDLGCSVGTMSYIFKKNGARLVTGIDHDPDAIKTALSLYGRDVGFSLGDISIDFFKDPMKYDITIWTSQFMWMVKQHGMEYALNFMFELSKECDVLVFETAGIGDGMAPLDLSQEEVLPMLIKNTCFQDIRDYGPWGDEWTTRNVFVCKNPKLKWESLLSTVERIDRKTIRKTYDVHSDRAYEICGRERYFLDKFRGHANFPNLIDSKKSSHSIEMEYAGIPTLWIPDGDIEFILRVLSTAQIVHRDIQPSNILWNGENCVLIDWAYAINKGDITNYHYDLGGKFRCPHGFNDEFSLRLSQAYLREKQLNG